MSREGFTGLLVRMAMGSDGWAVRMVLRASMAPG